MAKLDISLLSDDVQQLQSELESQIIGQSRAIRQVIRSYVPMTVNIHREHRTLGNLLFMGPTGVGKSETVKALAKHLLGDRNSLTKVDCTEFQREHDVMKLLGAPPSYVGYNDTPRLAQEKIDQFQTKKNKVNIILFDEIEKAHPALFDAILSILGDAELTLGNGKHVDFSRTLVFLTSNLGAKDIAKMLAGGGLGFKTEEEQGVVDDRIYKASKAAIEKAFRPEFLNRIDRMIVFRSLEETSLMKILEIELRALQFRIWRSPYRDFQIGSGTAPERFSAVFKLTDEAKKFLIKEGTSDAYGARELNRTVDRYLAYPLAALISSKQIGSADKIKVSHEDGEDELTFEKDGTLPMLKQ